MVAQDVLTNRHDMVWAISQALILRDELRFSTMVTDRHAAATDSTDGEALQQGRTFACGAPPAILSEGESTLPKTLLIVLILRPRGVTSMHIFDQHPLLPRQFYVRSASIRSDAGTISAVSERARVAWIVQDVQSPAMGEFPPFQLAFVRPPFQSLRKQETFLTESFDHGTCRTCAVEHVK